MRILLAANASYVPPRGGATRSNLVWMDHLSGAGHDCQIVCATLPDSAGRREQIRQEGIEAQVETREHGLELTRRGGIAVWSVEDPGRRVHLLREQIEAFRPDWVLVSSEDLAHGLLREALHRARGRVVYLAHTPQFFPFGPESWNPDPHGAEMAASAAGIVAIGRSMARYIEEQVGRPVAVIHPPIYGSGPWPVHANFERGLITMINPCAVKGISIFLDLAARFPNREFGALPGWGTTSEDRRALGRLPNICVLPNRRDIDEILNQTRILLMPSLWYEGFGLIVMEAMLRGIPVVSSDSGGLVEAKQGSGYVIPVEPVERYEPAFDERGMPRPVTRPHNLAPWEAALEELLGDREKYRLESERSRKAALEFVGGLSAGNMEQFLRELHTAPAAAEERPQIESLSPEKRTLLLERLRKRGREAG